MEDYIGNPDSKNKRSSGHLKLLAIIMLSASPIIIAAFMYFGGFGVPSETTNKGNLIIPPLSSELLGIEQIHAEEPGFQQVDGNRKWLILIVADSACKERCERALYLSRQVHVALGREATRVNRLLLLTERDTHLDTLLQEHPGLVIQEAEPSRIIDLIEAVGLHDLLLDSYDMLLVDPLGNIMLHYKTEQEGKDLLDDLKRLLKVSKIG